MEYPLPLLVLMSLGLALLVGSIVLFNHFIHERKRRTLIIGWVVWLVAWIVIAIAATLPAPKPDYREPVALPPHIA